MLMTHFNVSEKKKNSGKGSVQFALALLWLNVDIKMETKEPQNGGENRNS